MCLSRVPGNVVECWHTNRAVKLHIVTSVPRTSHGVGIAELLKRVALPVVLTRRVHSIYTVVGQKQRKGLVAAAHERYIKNQLRGKNVVAVRGESAPTTTHSASRCKGRCCQKGSRTSSSDERNLRVPPCRLVASGPNQLL